MKLTVVEGGTALQREALRLKMEALGLEVDEERELRPESIARFPGGVDALEAVADKRGRLSLSALEKLLEGSPQAAEGAALNLKSIQLAVEGATKLLEEQTEDPEGLATATNVAGVARRAAILVESLSSITQTHREDLLQGPADRIDKLAFAVSELTKACTQYLKASSAKRIELLSEPARTAQNSAQAASLLAASSQMIDALMKISDLAALGGIRATFRHYVQNQIEAGSDLRAALAHGLRRTETIFGTQLNTKDAQAIVAGSWKDFDAGTLNKLRRIVRSDDDWAGLRVPSTHEYMRAALQDPLDLDVAAFEREVVSASWDPNAILRAFERADAFRDLFAEWSGVSEGYSIRAHNLRLFESLREHFGAWKMDELDVGDIRLERLFLGLIPLHDIGKPVAVEDGDKDLQHHFTVPILSRALDALGFTSKEAQLARVLVNNDLFGDVVKHDSFKKKSEAGQQQTQQTAETEHEKPKHDAASVVSQITEMAKNVGLEPKTYFELQLFFYTLDASSYPGLKKRVFEQGQTRLLPKSPTLWEAYALLGGSKPA